MSDLHDVFNYTTHDGKTEQKLFVSGINCVPEIAIKQMIMTKQQFGKTDKILAFHAIQSFKPGEVTPHDCHEIGTQLAREMWGERFQVVVATHLDKSHLHTHFAINSVSFLDGKKYNSCKAANQRLRDVSDRLCNERSLSVIENPSKEKTNRTVYLAEKKGEPTLYNVFRQTIDKTIAASMTSRDFERNLRVQGFEIKMTGKYWSIKMIGDNHTTRLYRLGEQYTNSNITKRVYERGLYRPIPFHTPPKSKPLRVSFQGNLRTAKKLTGFRALYVNYLYLLGKLPKKKPRPPRHPILWEDIRKLDTYTAQIRLLHINKIDTSPQLQAHKENTQNRMNSLIGERTKIYNKLRRANKPEVVASLKKQRDALTAEIAVCRKEVKLCDGIFENTRRMKEKMAVIRKHENSLQQQKTIMKERGSRDAR